MTQATFGSRFLILWEQASCKCCCSSTKAETSGTSMWVRHFITALFSGKVSTSNWGCSERLYIKNPSPELNVKIYINHWYYIGIASRFFWKNKNNTLCHYSAFHISKYGIDVNNVAGFFFTGKRYNFVTSKSKLCAQCPIPFWWTVRHTWSRALKPYSAI